MSWDFYMVADLSSSELLTVLDDVGCTYNLSPMYQAAMGGDGIRELLDGKTGAECLAVLEPAIAAMEGDPAKYKALNPSNGWGDYEGAVNVLRDLRTWCLKAPRAIMRVG